MRRSFRSGLLIGRSEFVPWETGGGVDGLAEYHLVVRKGRGFRYVGSETCAITSAAVEGRGSCRREDEYGFLGRLGGRDPNRASTCVEGGRRGRPHYEAGTRENRLFGRDGGELQGYAHSCELSVTDAGTRDLPALGAL